MTFLVGTLLCHSQVATAEEASSMKWPFRISLSVSPFAERVFESGVTLTAGEHEATNVEELQQLFVAYGANEVYTRINTRNAPGHGHADHSLVTGLTRAELAKKLGIPLNPELGLFGTYGDVRFQPPPNFSDYPEIELPGPWETLTLDQMCDALRKYGEIVARQILDTGVEVRIWDLGNEVEFGVAGLAVQPMPGDSDVDEGGPKYYKAPDGVDPEIGKQSIAGLLQLPVDERIAWMKAHLWPYMGKYFAAAAEGIRKADPDARFSTHTSGIFSTRPEESLAFFSTMGENGYLPDELGFSFYPSSSDEPNKLAKFKETMKLCMGELERPAFIAEYGYAAEPMTVGGFAGWDKTAGNYPISNEGQAALLRDIASWGAAAGLSGIRPWAPELAAPGWEPIALFDAQDGKAVGRPALGAIKEGAANPDLNALDTTGDEAKPEPEPEEIKLPGAALE